MEVMIEMKAMTGKIQELYQTLQALLPTLRKCQGCRDCRICRDVEDGEIFILKMDWETRISLEQYLRSSSGGALFGAVDLLSENTRVRFDQEGSLEGIDSLKKMRKEHEARTI